MKMPSRCPLTVGTAGEYMKIVKWTAFICYLLAIILIPLSLTDIGAKVAVAIIGYILLAVALALTIIVAILENRKK